MLQSAESIHTCRVDFYRRTFILNVVLLRVCIHFKCHLTWPYKGSQIYFGALNKEHQIVHITENDFLP